jgi:hypothetical protein
MTAPAEKNLLRSGSIRGSGSPIPIANTKGIASLEFRKSAISSLDQ